MLFVEVIRNDAKLHALTADTEHYMTVDITEKAAFERVVGLTDNLVDGMKAYTSGIPIVRLFSTSVFCCDPRGHLHTTFFCVSFYCDGDFHDGFNKFVDKHW